MSQKIKLLHATTVPLSLNFLQGQVGYMREAGLEVHALSSGGEALRRFGQREGVPVHAVEMKRSISPLQDLRAVAEICRTLRRLRPQIVHAHTPKAGLLLMISAWLARVPVRVYHIHGLPLMTAHGLKRLLLSASERTACRLAHQVFCVSRSVAEVAVASGLCSPEKIKVLLQGSINGVDAAGKFNPEVVGTARAAQIRQQAGIGSQAQVLGFIGRIVRDKGWIELAAAWRQLREEFPRLHLMVLGPFEPQDPVPADVEKLLREDPRIHLLGFIHELADYYAAMDLVVLPTYREGFPVTPLEAAAMGLPVVATQIPGCVEAVEDGVTGSLVAPRDATALTSALRRYLEDESLRRQHGAAGRVRVLRHFRPRAVWEAMHGEYCRLLQARGVWQPQSGPTFNLGEPA